MNIPTDEANGAEEAESSGDGSEDEEFSEAESEQEEELEEQEDPLIAAERAKEEGNTQFKQQRYGMAIDLYTRAHGASFIICFSFFGRWLTICILRPTFFATHLHVSHSSLGIML